MPETSKTTSQALTLLTTIATHQPVSAADLCRILTMNRTVAHRLLTTLHQHGYVRRTGDDYRIGPVVAQLARNIEPSLQEAAAPVMKRLAEDRGETVVLQVVDADQAVILAQRIARRHVVRVEQNLITRHPMHLGASGRVLLAAQPDRTVNRMLRQVKDADRVRRQVAEIRATGYAVSHDELQEGVHAVSAPIAGADANGTAALTVLVPVSRADIVPGLVDPVIAAAKEIEAGLVGE